MNLTILNTPLSAREAVKAANTLKGRLPHPGELLDMDFTKSNIEELRTTLKHVSFWTSELVNTQYCWAVDKRNQIKFPQHHSCLLSVMIITN